MAILDGLDNIAWATLRHSYGSAATTPTDLRLLCSSEKADRDKAYEHLYGAVLHQGDVMSATVAVVPFLVELANDENTPDRYRVLAALYNVVEACNEHLLGIQYHRSEAMLGRLRHDIEAYLNVVRGIEVYLPLLTHPTTEIRHRAALLIGKLTDCGQRSKGALWAAIQREGDDTVLRGMLGAFDTLVQQMPPDPDELDVRAGQNAQQYLPYLDRLWETHASNDIRLQAAICRIHLSDVVGFLDGRKVPEALITWLVHSAEESPLAFGIGESNAIRALVECGPNALITALRTPKIAPLVSHHIARELLALEFAFKPPASGRGGGRRWQEFEDIDKGLWNFGFKGRYAPARDFRGYVADKRLTRPQTVAVAAIVACDAFWKLPTNLFSFYFGLPDDRDALRRLTEQRG